MTKALLNMRPLSEPGLCLLLSMPLFLNFSFSINANILVERLLFLGNLIVVHFYYKVTKTSQLLLNERKQGIIVKISLLY